MKRGWKWVVNAVAVLVLLIAVGLAWNWENVQRLVAVNTLFTEERIVSNFSSMKQLFHYSEFPQTTGPVSMLPVNLRPLPDLSDWAERRALTAIVILKDGEIAYENYYQGTSPDDRRISWSVAKSYLSALLGILVAEGIIKDIDDPVTRYAPSLVGTAYDGATIRNVLQMASGVHFTENYLDFNSDVNRMGRAFALGRSLNKFVAGISERDRAPGEAWQYVSVDTHVLGMVIQGATGRSITDLMAEKLIQPMGLQATPYYLTDSYGTAFVLGGLNMTTRDYARFGQMFLQDGYWNGQQIVPAEWVQASTAASSPTAEGEIRYGYQWWVPYDGAAGEFLARGIYGQYVYINRPAQIVIAVNSADRHFQEPGAFAETLDMFRQIAAALETPASEMAEVGSAALAQ